MGYILPINSVQIEQYANRKLREDYFATVRHLQPVNLNSDFRHEFKEAVVSKQREYKKNIPNESALTSSNSLSEVKGFIYPNPENLSPAIAQIVGKGLAINTYV